MPAKRVLIIDDEAQLQELLTIAFTSRDYKVFTASNGEEGLKLASSKKPDIIVLDIKMPRLNGYEFLSRIRKDEHLRETPIIVFTSLTEDSNRSDEEWANSLEVADFVSKPVEPLGLVERVERVLSSKNAG